MEFVIMFSIRKISDDSKYRKDMFKSKRKSVEEIWEGEKISGVTDIVRRQCDPSSAEACRI